MDEKTRNALIEAHEGGADNVEMGLEGVGNLIDEINEIPEHETGNILAIRMWLKAQTLMSTVVSAQIDLLRLDMIEANEGMAEIIRALKQAKSLPGLDEEE